jgi:hypothetical protein
MFLQPAVLTTKQCYDYCGGEPTFEELLIHHSDVLKPLRITERGDTSYRRVTVDAALAIAENQGTLRNAEGTIKRNLLLKTKQARRFKS